MRPDGNETFVQNGYLRTSWRKIASGSNNMFKEPSTLLDPIPSAGASDLEPLPKNKFVEVVIPLYYEGHVYRAGSRIRVTIAAPNGAQPVWSFKQTLPRLGNREGVGGILQDHALKPDPPGGARRHCATGLPPCPGLRNEPCRPYQAITNRTANG